jgi:cardiolipin synthase A/B
VDLRERAGRLVGGPVQRDDLVLAFDETVASTVDVHVEGRNFFPLILRDIAAATSSVHINQFGFRPGAIGDAFATALLAKAAEGVPVRMVVDGSGSRPDRSGREFYGRLRAGGIDVRVVRAMRPRAGCLDHLGHPDHRKLFVIDGRVGWVGGAGVEDHFEDGRFHDLFVRLTGPVVSQLQLVFVASYRWLGGDVPQDAVAALFPSHEEGAIPAIVLHNAPGKYRPITTAIADLFEQARESLDVVNPYVVDRRMIERIVAAARRGVAVRLFVPGKPNNWFCANAQRHHHAGLIGAGVRILEHPSMLHAKAFVRDGEEVLAGTCNLEAWSLQRSFEIDVLVRSREFAAQFEERFSTPAEAVSSPGRAMTGPNRVLAAAFAAISPVL